MLSIIENKKIIFYTIEKIISLSHPKMSRNWQFRVLGQLNKIIRDLGSFQLTALLTGVWPWSSWSKTVAGTSAIPCAFQAAG